MIRLPLCILFDLDGTILDSLPGIEATVRSAFEACRLPAPSGSLRTLIGPPIRTMLSRAGAITDPSALDALEREFRQRYDNDGWKQTSCYPAAARALHLLRDRGHRLFVVSNKPRHISLAILEKEEILCLFEEILTRDSRVPRWRGKDEMIEALLRRLNIAPEECAMVGDTIEDAEAAAANGIRFIYMAHGYGPPGNVFPAPTCRFNSFSEFLTPVAEELVGD